MKMIKTLLGLAFVGSLRSNLLPIVSATNFNFYSVKSIILFYNNCWDGFLYAKFCSISIRPYLS
jgi:hypothetical protein